MKKLIILFFFITGFAFGLSFTETDLGPRVQLEIIRLNSMVRFIVSAETVDANGNKIRNVSHDIWDTLTTNQQDQINQLINAAVNRAKQLESIS